MTIQHVIKVNGQIQTIKKSYTEIIKLENGNSLELIKGYKHVAKEVYRQSNGMYNARLVTLF